MSNGTGFTRLWANASMGRIDVALTGITMSHIHFAMGIRRNLVPFAGGMLNPTMNYVGGTNWFTVWFTSANTNITALKLEIKGNTSYVNVHTVKYPGGEIQAYLKCRAVC
ncbi:hypothetical protein HYH03_002998 [Edaphochlamys debaryana]|uniref:CHRD domain-containing protein n=1 Tax=Edaphochlamys debaryana TaxID=47281 RepID=A0A836C4I4_9CHLO|nr:hypothetical protein HYH03_002998 [Edaphochlamys debaryana]|eukprot:KAG2498804.1 hypothetical protein HYH03_002998 [Edaphochlamys debaryana]